MSAVNFVSDHPENIVSKQRDPNTPKAPWLVAATIKLKRLESEGAAASQLCVTLQGEINEFSAELRDTENKSDAELGAVTAALNDAKTRLAAAKINSDARLGLTERARKAVDACRHLDSTNEQKHQTTAKRQTLKAVLEEIEKINLDVQQVANSQRPLDELEASLRSYLGALASPRNALVNLCADVLTANMPITEIVGHPNSLAARGFGLALAANGVDAIIDEALTKAQANDPGCLRMTADERAERLASLAKARYLAEMEEETLLAGNERRPNMNAGAVLGIPIDVAEQAGLIGERK
jgi:hypothetical protein